MTDLASEQLRCIILLRLDFSNCGVSFRSFYLPKITVMGLLVKGKIYNNVGKIMRHVAVKCVMMDHH